MRVLGALGLLLVLGSIPAVAVLWFAERQMVGAIRPMRRTFDKGQISAQTLSEVFGLPESVFGTQWWSRVTSERAPHFEVFLPVAADRLEPLRALFREGAVPNDVRLDAEASQWLETMCEGVAPVPMALSTVDGGTDLPLEAALLFQCKADFWLYLSAIATDSL